MVNKEITWSKTALRQFESAINFIASDSIKDSEKVRERILEKIAQLVSYPEMHSPDKQKNKNDGSYRAFEIYHYRIAYRIKEKEILIFRVRHTSMEPKKY
jgi:plasmid stabilization system protein ParE